MQCRYFIPNINFSEKKFGTIILSKNRAGSGFGTFTLDRVGSRVLKFFAQVHFGSQKFYSIPFFLHFGSKNFCSVPIFPLNIIQILLNTMDLPIGSVCHWVILCQPWVRLHGVFLRSSKKGAGSLCCYFENLVQNRHNLYPIYKGKMGQNRATVFDGN